MTILWLSTVQPVVRGYDVEFDAYRVKHVCDRLRRPTADQLALFQRCAWMPLGQQLSRVPE